MILDSNKSQILLSSRAGFEFEFFSKYSPQETAVRIGRLLGKKIQVEDKSHSDFSPTADHFKIEPDMSGGKKLVELVTGALPYADARILLIKVLKWVKENGRTSDRCGIHLNISFDEKKHGTTFLSHLNVLKFILDFDEDFVYKLFPKRTSNVYAKSIKFIVPREKYYFDNLTNLNPYNFLYPSEKYYGINFSKLTKNYLEFRYLGGQDYENRTTDILKLLDHFVLELYNSAKNQSFTQTNYNELRKILNRYQHLTASYLSFDNFKKYYPEVGFLIDLDSDDRRINSYWGQIRDKLYSLLKECDLKDGIINYDTDVSKLQVKGANLSNSYKITNVDLVDCNVSGVISNCDIFTCDIQHAEIYDCNLFNQSTAKGSKLRDCYVNRNCQLDDCYIYGKKGIMNGEMKGGIFREGRITRLSKFDGTEIIEFEKIKTTNHVRY